MGKSPMEIGVPHEAIGEAISEPHPAGRGEEKCPVNAESGDAVEWVLTAKD